MSEEDLMSEADIMTAIRKRLGAYQACGDILWFLRINSGKIYHNGHYIQLAPRGTPDWLVLVRDKNKNLTIIFLEAKSEIGRLSKEQLAFEITYHNDKDILYYIIKNISQLSNIINTVAFDRTTLLPDNI